MIRPTIRTGLAATLSLALTLAATSRADAALILAVDVDSTVGGPIDTESGFTSLDGTGGNGSSVTISGVTFTVLSAGGSRNRGGVPNSLTTDFVFDDGGGAAVGLSVDGLPAGRYRAEIWAWDQTSPAGPQQVMYRQTVPSSSEVTINASAATDPVNPIQVFEFVSDGTSKDEFFNRESAIDGNNRSRLNALRLTQLTEANHGVELITNGGFEDPALPATNGFTDTDPTGWLGNNDFGGGTGRVGVIGEDRSSVAKTPDGTQLLHMQDDGVGDPTQVGQRIGGTELSGLRLDLSYLVTRRTNESTATDHLVELIAGDSNTYVGGTVLLSESYDTPLSAANRFNYVEMSMIVPDLGGSSDLWLVFTHDLGASGQLHFDQISAVAIPEPSALALAAFGLVGLAIFGRRRRR